MKEEIEENQLPNQVKNYLEIENQIKALRRTLFEVGGKKIKFIKTIDKLLASFKKVESAPDFRIIKWGVKNI